MEKQNGKYGKNKMKKKVLITGGTGFIGNNVVEELLKRNYEIHLIVYDIPNKINNKNIIIHQLNLLNIEEVNNFFKKNNFENLIHLAWFVGKKCHISNINIDWTIATLNILKQFQLTGGKKYLQTGTNSEYEYKYGYLIEDMTPASNGILRGTCENSLYRIAKDFCKNNNIDFKWARVFNLYGENERESRLMPSVINSCLKNEDVKVSTCLKFQDYLYVKDTAKAIVDIFESSLEGAVNVCSNQPIQLKTIVEKIVELTNFKGKILYGAVEDSIGENVVIGNNDKLKSIGWKQEYSLEDGLKLVINWWKKKIKEDNNNKM